MRLSSCNTDKFQFNEVIKMIDITAWTEDFLQALNETFANRVWFVGLQGSKYREIYRLQADKYK